MMFKRGSPDDLPVPRKLLKSVSKLCILHFRLFLLSHSLNLIQLSLNRPTSRYALIHVRLRHPCFSLFRSLATRLTARPTSRFANRDAAHSAVLTATLAVMCVTASVATRLTARLTSRFTNRDATHPAFPTANLSRKVCRDSSLGWFCDYPQSDTISIEVILSVSVIGFLGS
jgi:hypothetical protein